MNIIRTDKVSIHWHKLFIPVRVILWAIPMRWISICWLCYSWLYKTENFIETMKLQLKVYESKFPTLTPISCIQCIQCMPYSLAACIHLNSYCSSNDQLYHFQKSNQTLGNGLTKNYGINNALPAWMYKDGYCIILSGWHLLMKLIFNNSHLVSRVSQIS